MSDVPALPLDDLLAPLEGESACGEDLRYEGLYDSIADLRKEDDPDAPRGVWEADVRQADWAAVRKLAEEALTSRTKDLQVAAWLTESLGHLRGLAGLAEGLELMARLCALYWPDLYPLLDPDDDEMEGRMGPVEWISKTVRIAITTMPLTDPVGTERVRYTWQNWVQAQRLEAVAATDTKKFEAAVKKGSIPLSRFTSAAANTPVDFYKQWMAGLRQVRGALESLKGVLDDEAGGYAPSFRDTIDLLREMTAMVERLLADRGIGERAVPAAPAEDGGDGDDRPGSLGPATDGGADGPLLARPIASRQEAYDLLLAAANYLSAIEPHSPAPYLVKRAVRWGTMPLNELLAELMEDTSGTSQVFKLLRLRDPK
jgi:type VI secretion system ImpA family protein